MSVPPIPAPFLQPQSPMGPAEAESAKLAADTLLDESLNQKGPEVTPKTVEVTQKEADVSQKGGRGDPDDGSGQ